MGGASASGGPGGWLVYNGDNVVISKDSANHQAIAQAVRAKAEAAAAAQAQAEAAARAQADAAAAAQAQAQADAAALAQAQANQAAAESIYKQTLAPVDSGAVAGNIGSLAQLLELVQRIKAGGGKQGGGKQGGSFGTPQLLGPAGPAR